jgi:hypothetical protein
MPLTIKRQSTRLQHVHAELVATIGGEHQAAAAINPILTLLFRLCSVRAGKMTEDDHR